MKGKVINTTFAVENRYKEQWFAWLELEYLPELSKLGTPHVMLIPEMQDGQESFRSYAVQAHTLLSASDIEYWVENTQSTILEKLYGNISPSLLPCFTTIMDVIV